MWGISNRGARLAEGRRNSRTFVAGLTRIVLRGPVEHTLVELEGELDFTCTDEVMRAIEALPFRIAGIDVSQLDFVDSRGVEMLRDLANDIAVRHGRDRIEITGVPRHLQRTFDLVQRYSTAV